MTYNVSSGTLNTTIPYHTEIEEQACIVNHYVDGINKVMMMMINSNEMMMFEPGLCFYRYFTLCFSVTC